MSVRSFVGWFKPDSTRLLVLGIVQVLMAAALFGSTLWLASKIAESDACVIVNEQNRKLVVAFSDLGYPVIADRFLPTEDCESLP